jgi:hypothetical protein
MQQVDWDTVLSLMFHREVDVALFFSGSQPLMRMKHDFRPMMIARFDAQDVRNMWDSIAERMREVLAPHGVSTVDGYSYIGLIYHETDFRVMFMDRSEFTSLVITRLELDERPPPPNHPRWANL